jgi:hypothetical protein
MGIEQSRQVMSVHGLHFCAPIDQHETYDD